MELFANGIDSIGKLGSAAMAASAQSEAARVAAKASTDNTILNQMGQQLYLNQQDRQFEQEQQFNDYMLSRSLRAQRELRDDNLRLLSSAAKEAGVPLYSILQGNVPRVSTQLLGTNFATTPAGADPFNYRQWLVTPGQEHLSLANRVNSGLVGQHLQSVQHRNFGTSWSKKASSKAFYPRG